jgi:hypothetical protein
MLRTTGEVRVMVFNCNSSVGLLAFLVVSFLGLAACGEDVDLSVSQPSTAEGPLTYGLTVGTLRATVTNEIYQDYGVLYCYPESGISVISGTYALTHLDTANWTDSVDPEVQYARKILGSAGAIALLFPNLSKGKSDIIYVPYPGSSTYKGSNGFYFDLSPRDTRCVTVTTRDGYERQGHDCQCSSGVCVDCVSGGAACASAGCGGCPTVRPPPPRLKCGTNAPFVDSTPVESLKPSTIL